MNSYNTFDLRIKKIKATIDDIRGDLENLKNKNETKINNSIIETQQYNHNTTHDDNQIKTETADCQSEFSVPNNKYKIPVDVFRNNNTTQVNDQSLYRARYKDTQKEDQVNEENTRRQRNYNSSFRKEILARTQYEDNKSKDNSFKNESFFRSNSPALPRSYSNNKIGSGALNYDYSAASRNNQGSKLYASRNQYNNNSSSRLQTTKRYEASTRDPNNFRTTQPQQKIPSPKISNKSSHNYENNYQEREREYLSQRPMRDVNEEISNNNEGIRNYSRNQNKDKNKRQGDTSYRSKNSRSRLEAFSDLSGNSYEDRKVSPNDYRRDKKNVRDNFSNYMSEQPHIGNKMFETSKYSSTNLNREYKEIQLNNEFSRTHQHNDPHKYYENKSLHDYSNPNTNLENQIKELKEIILDLRRKNTELQRKLSEKDVNEYGSNNIPFDVRKQSNITLEKEEQLSEPTRNSPKFNHKILSRDSHQRKLSDYNENEYYLNKIKEKLGVTRNEEALKQIDELVERKNFDKLKENLIEKLFEVYNSHNLTAKNDIKELWRWLKKILKDSIKTHETKPAEQLKMEECKEFCDNIIKDFGLKDVKELKGYMNDLAAKNVKNKTRVERMKKLLMSDPTSKHSINESQIPK